MANGNKIKTVKQLYNDTVQVSVPHAFCTITAEKMRDCVHLKSRGGGGGLDSSVLAVCEILWPPPVSACFCQPPFCIVKKIMPPPHFVMWLLQKISSMKVYEN